MDKQHPTPLEALTGGNTSGTVYKANNTIRKRWTPATPSIHQYLHHLHTHNISVPQPLGQDENNHQILEYIPGTPALEMPPLSLETLHSIGALIRQIHDASKSFIPAPGAIWETAIQAPGSELICHNDLAPWNLIIDNEKFVFIDWDASASSTVLWDLAYATTSFCLLDISLSAELSAKKLSAFIQGYGADNSLRSQLPEAMKKRVQAMFDLLYSSFQTGNEPWATMYQQGHGEHWAGVCKYVAEHQKVWEQALDPRKAISLP